MSRIVSYLNFYARAYGRTYDTATNSFYGQKLYNFSKKLLKSWAKKLFADIGIQLRNAKVADLATLFQHIYTIYTTYYIFHTYMIYTI